MSGFCVCYLKRVWQFLISKQSFSAYMYLQKLIIKVQKETQFWTPKRQIDEDGTIRLLHCLSNTLSRKKKISVAFFLLLINFF